MPDSLTLSPPADVRVATRTAILTRASVGIGPALALALAERGWRLVLDDSAPRTLEAQAAGLATATEVVAVAGDVFDAGHREVLVAAAGPQVDLLINNAAPPARDTQPAAGGYPLDALEGAYRDSVLAPLAMIQLALPHLAPGGQIVNVVPRAAGSPRVGDVGESAAVALEQLTGAIAAANPHLRVRAIDPSRPGSRSEALEGIAGLA